MKTQRLLFLTVVVIVLSGCRQEMYNQPRYEALENSDFFDDGMAARPIPEHTVARGHLNEDVHFYTGKTDDGKLVQTLPVPLTRELLARGRDRFNIYCAVCHSRTGDGTGMIVQRGFPAPPSFHTKRLRDAPIGHFYDVITNGYGVMYSYAVRVEPADRWAIAAYIRALQLSHQATPDDVLMEHRAELK